MTRILAFLLLVAGSVTGFAQGQSSLRFLTTADLVNYSIPSISTALTAFVGGDASSGIGTNGGTFFYIGSSSLATNTTSVFKPAGSNGRWINILRSFDANAISLGGSDIASNFNQIYLQLLNLTNAVVSNYIANTNGFGYGLSTTNLTNNGVNLQTTLDSKANQSNLTIVSNQVTGKLAATNGLSIGLTNIGSLVTGSIIVTNNGSAGALIFANNGSGGSANQQLAKTSNWAINGDHAGDFDLVSLQQINISANNGTTDNLTITSGGINVTGTITSTLTAKAPYFKPANDQFVVMGDSMSNDSIDWPNRLPLFDSIENRSFYTNFAIAGQTLAEIDANYLIQAGSVVPTTNSYRWGEVFAGHNDIKTNATAVATFAHLTNVLFKLSNDGYFRTVFTMPPGSDLTGSKETERVAYNALIRSNPQLYDVLIPVDVLLPDNLNTNYYDSDGIHPNVNGSDVLAFFRAKTIRTKPWMLIASANYNSLPPNLVVNPSGRFTGVGTMEPWTSLTVGGNTANGAIGITNFEAAPYRSFIGVVGLTNLITGDSLGDLSIVSYNNNGKIHWSANAGTTDHMSLDYLGNLIVSGNVTSGSTVKGTTMIVNKNSVIGSFILSNTVAGAYRSFMGIAGSASQLINGDALGDFDIVSYNNSGHINFSSDNGTTAGMTLGSTGVGIASGLAVGGNATVTGSLSVGALSATTLKLNANSNNGTLVISNTAAGPYKSVMGVVGSASQIINGDALGDLDIMSYNNSGSINFSINNGSSIGMNLNSTGLTIANALSVTGNASAAQITGTSLIANRNSGNGSLIVSNTASGAYRGFLGVAGSANQMVTGDAAGDLDIVSYNNSGGINISVNGGTARQLYIGQSGLVSSGFMDATNGFKVSGAATTGNYLRGNGTVFTGAALAATDLTGTIAAARMPAFTGVVSTTVGAVATSINTGLGVTNNSGTLSNNIVAGSNMTITAGANGQLTLASTASGGGGTVGTMINTASTTAGQLVQFSDNQKTNASPVTLGLGLTNNASVLSNNIAVGNGLIMTAGGSGQLTIAATDKVNVLGVNTSYSILSTDDIVYTTGSSTTLTLPSMTGITGKRITIKNYGTAGSNTIACSGSDNIEGSATYTLTNAYSSITVVSGFPTLGWAVIASRP